MRLKVPGRRHFALSAFPSARTMLPLAPALLSPSPAPFQTPQTRMKRLLSSAPAPIDLLKAPPSPICSRRHFALPAFPCARTMLPLAPALLSPSPAPFQTQQTQMKRLFSSAPAPIDLLKAPPPPICSTKPFEITVGCPRKLQKSMDNDKIKAKQNLDVKRLRENFEKQCVEAALIRRGLLWEKPLSDEETCWLNFEYHRITGSYPRFFTTLGIMVHLEELPRPYWRPFFDFLSREKAVVIRDWSTKLHTRVGFSMYDRGVKGPYQDNVVWSKGESDGSYPKEKSDGSFDEKEGKCGSSMVGSVKQGAAMEAAMDGVAIGDTAKGGSVKADAAMGEAANQWWIQKRAPGGDFLLLPPLATPLLLPPLAPPLLLPPTSPYLHGSATAAKDDVAIGDTAKGGAAKGRKSKLGPSKKEEVKNSRFGAILWTDDQLNLCEVYHDVPCISSVHAEAKGMYLQLKRGKELELEHLVACTDNSQVYNAVRGLLVADPFGGMYDLLRSLRGDFQGLIPRWLPRSELNFIDGILRDDRLKSKGGGRKQRFETIALIRRWSLHLSGQPIFTIEGNKPSVKMPSDKLPVFAESCFLEVQEQEKLDALCLVTHALKPTRLHIVANKNRFHGLESVQDHFGISDHTVVLKDNCCIKSLNPLFECFKGARELVVVMDGSIPKSEYEQPGAFTVYLTTPEEKSVIQEYCITPFGPMSFVAFHK